MMNLDELKHLASDSAKNHQVYRKGRISRRIFPGIDKDNSIILDAYKAVNEVIKTKGSILPAAEWLADNFYMIEEQIKDIYHSIPKSYYSDLPVLKTGSNKGYPRTYAIAVDIISHTDGIVDEDVIINYIEEYQRQVPLMACELWSVPLMLKIALIKKISSICADIMITQYERLKADVWAERLLNALEGSTGELQRMISSHEDEIEFINSAYGERLLRKLRDYGSNSAPIIRWIDGKLAIQKTDADQITQQEHQRQAAYQISIGNAITSLRFLSGLKWGELFEKLSLLEQILKKDPAKVYSLMDFASRDYYRTRIQKMSKDLNIGELEIAEKAIECAQQAGNNESSDDKNRDGKDQKAMERLTHVGYYVLGGGKKQLEARLQIKKSGLYVIKSRISEHSSLFYFGSLSILTAIIMVGFLNIIYYQSHGISLGLMLLSAIIGLIPILSIAVGLLNWIITHVYSPCLLPKLELKEGIPEELRTMVVIPTLLSSEKRVFELAEQMEVFYLANQEKNLHFALVGDFKDCRQGQHMPEDDKIIESGIKAINGLNEKYGQDIFYFFHRDRQWNDAQSSWLGWERKRGALVEFNRLLQGDQNTSYSVKIGAMEVLPLIKYVITLDADTQLPRDTAKKLIGAMAHPLNTPVLNDEGSKVIEGYGLLQPRIGVAVDSASRSFFSLTFSGQTGIDPYTTAVSDVYQDLFGEGIFTGKGIYDIEVFNKILADAIPDNYVLSHDLLEGSYIRAGLVTDIELIDGYPSHYIAYAMRQHRWVRGDWQLIPWLGNYIKNSKGERVKNPVNTVSKWKMIDNMRRSLLWPSLLVLIFFAFLVMSASLRAWVWLAVLTLAFPIILDMIDRLSSMSKPQYGAYRIADVFSGAKNVVWQILLSFVFLAYQAYLTLDAILRTLGRILFTHRNMLEWVTAADTEKKFQGLQDDFWRKMWPSTAISAIFFVTVILGHFDLWPAAFIFAAVWAAAPYFAYIISRPMKKRRPELSNEQIDKLRIIARKTWRYFEDFVGQHDSWLPPDNYQEDPPSGVAHRTSPTNIGLLLMSTLAARDLGYIGILETLERLERTVATMSKMDKWNGHFYNWYDTTTLKPLRPLYVSSVDSGNLAGYLITLKHGIEDMLNEPFIDKRLLLGLKDTLHICSDKQLSAVNGKLDNIIDEALRKETITFKEWNCIINSLKSKKKELDIYIQSFEKELYELIPWVSLLQDVPDIFKEEVSDEKESKKIFLNLIEKLDSSLSLNDLLSEYGSILDNLSQAIAWINRYSLQDDRCKTAKEWLKQLELALGKSFVSVKKLVNRCRVLNGTLDKLFNEMDFSILYDEKKELFSIGYDFEEDKLSKSYYDLLASEARQTSFIAIAKGDVPQKHWFKLGRVLTLVEDTRVLLSWSGTMFEYLMPLLIMRNYDYTLLDETYTGVVKAQKIYGEQRRVPWGISESGFYAFDLQLNYQYKAFGVPKLGLKRGLINDMVVAPYATILALPIAPVDAIKNIDYFIQEGMDGKYGLYEAIDFTSTRLPHKQKNVIVKSYMVHHLGMGLLALDNFLNNNAMQKRFHSSPSIKATELLLQERIPQRDIFIKNYIEDELRQVSSSKEHDIRARRQFNTPHTSLPQTLLLSNGNYSIMLTNSGSGYSQCQGIAVNRWRRDVTRDNRGIYFYIQNLNSNNYWSAGYQPCGIIPDEYEVLFEPHRGTFFRRDGNIETGMDVVVSPEHNAEVRTISMRNKGRHNRVLEVTSYIETIISSLNSDIAHPAFNNLFVETEFIPEYNAILAVRRPRGHEDKPMWAVHSLVVQGKGIGTVQYETDRLKFIGRGRNLSRPLAMEAGMPLSNSTGAVLDPVMSLRKRVSVDPGETAKVSYIIGMANSREEAISLAQTYQSYAITARAFELAWTHSQVEMRYLNMTAKEANLYQEMAAHIFYISPTRRTREQYLLENKKGQSGLWAHGISGDIPIILLKVSSIDHMEIVKQMITAHEYWKLKGLTVDLVILNEYGNSYDQPIQDRLLEIVSISHARDLQNRSGGVFIIQSALIKKDDINLLHATACLVISGDQGDINSQVRQTKPDDLLPKVFKVPLHFRHIKKNRDKNTPDQSFELEFYNGLGGFLSDGKEYVITIDKDRNCPMPWSNVISNENIGFLVTELGSGYTWCENSRQNKLTPWSNDPVVDPPGEIVYIRDEDKGKVWSVTPSPVKDHNPYIIRHGQGYTLFEHKAHGISGQQLMFVPLEDRIKIIYLTLHNDEDVLRRLSLTYYVDWVLGINKHDEGPFIITKWDDEENILMAQNVYSDEYRDNLAFIASNIPVSSFTGDRTEFIGRNRDMTNPAGLKRQSLSGRVGAGYDSCGAIQVQVEIPPQGDINIIFMIGQQQSIQDVRMLVAKYSDRSVILESIGEVKNFWDSKLGIIKIHTPDKSMDFMVNRWLLYQTLACRMWARAAFYQCGGAYGFRDQLQDLMAVVYSNPDIARKQIILHASHQFSEGDVQHWWHPPFKGVRTRITDDLLFLPYVTADYIRVTGDYTILDEQAPFLVDSPLDPDEEDRYSSPKPSGSTASIYYHCIQAIERSLEFGDLGLPLIRGGDWNDGMNRIGIEGKGQSIWLGWFLYTVLKSFIPICRRFEDKNLVQRYEKTAEELLAALEKNGWDGGWYRRAYFDDGTPLGSEQNEECQIDSISQSWAVISGAARPERIKEAMRALKNYLVDKEEGIIKLLYPPFDKSELNPGYIKGYVPGVRENGGQYSHAGMWTIMAFAMLGDGNGAGEFYHMVNPVNHARTSIEVSRYKVEPYVIAADVYSSPPNNGRGGWTWYTGSAAWAYRVAVEWILGFKLNGDKLRIEPSIPAYWEGYKIEYRYKSSTYEVEVVNPEGINTSVRQIIEDGKELEQKSVLLVDDGKVHSVKVVMGSI